MKQTLSFIFKSIFKLSFTDMLFFNAYISRKGMLYILSLTCKVILVIIVLRFLVIKNCKLQVFLDTNVYIFQNIYIYIFYLIFVLCAIRSIIANFFVYAYFIIL